MKTSSRRLAIIAFLQIYLARESRAFSPSIVPATTRKHLELQSWAFARTRLPTKHFAHSSRELGKLKATSADLEETTRVQRWKLYAEMCRPSNLLPSFIFVVGGAFSCTRDASSIFNPMVLLSALATMIITSTSMVSNDYFDHQKGTDILDNGNVLARAELTPKQAKDFVSKFYSALLILICFAPTSAIRVLLMSGSISTFLYTRHFKPVTWLKNVSVAFICALAPAVGGMSAVAASGGGPLEAFLLPESKCAGLTISLFLGIMHRELLMDVVDTSADAASGVKTVPVKYGER